MPTLTVWSNLPPEAQRPMVAPWSDLLRHRLTGRLAGNETLHDPLAQDRARHQRLQAIVYIRQSTPREVQKHKESTRRQYALADRGLARLWLQHGVSRAISAAPAPSCGFA